MKTVKLKTLTKVTLDAGTVVTVTDAEAWRLSAFGLAEEVKEEPKDEPKCNSEQAKPKPQPAKKPAQKNTTKKSAAAKK